MHAESGLKKREEELRVLCNNIKQINNTAKLIYGSLSLRIQKNGGEENNAL